MLIFRSCQNSRYLWHDLAPRRSSYLSYSKIQAAKTVSLFTFSQKMRWKFWSKWSISKESAWLKQTVKSFGSNVTRKTPRALPFVLHNRLLPARDSWRVNTAHVSSFVLISILRGQPRTPPSGDNLGVLDYHLNACIVVWYLRTVQYRHLIPAPVVRTSASAWSYRHVWITCQK